MNAISYPHGGISHITGSLLGIIGIKKSNPSITKKRIVLTQWGITIFSNKKLKNAIITKRAALMIKAVNTVSQGESKLIPIVVQELKSNANAASSARTINHALNVTFSSTINY